MQDQLGDAFDNLAMAATAKNDTIDNLVKSVSELTTINTKQNEQIIKLTEDLKRTLAGNKSNNAIEKVPQMHGPIQMDIAGPVDTGWVGNIKAPIADSKQRGTNVKQSGRISWEAARREQDLGTHQMGNDGANQQGMKILGFPNGASMSTTQPEEL